MIAGVVLAAPLLWASAAPTPTWGWAVSALLLAVLLASLVTSRVVLGHGPAAPAVDWLLPYVTVGVAMCLAATGLARAWRWQVVGGLSALLAVSLGYGAFQRNLIGNQVQIPIGDAAPLTSGLRVADGGRTDCGTNGALCDRQVVIRTARSPEEVRSVLRSHGWSADCRPVTGILTAVADFDYGSRCVSVDAGRESSVVVVGLLGKADWWLKVERGP
ncbi:hypothetical protein [Micromonospora coerulea]|uniref:hypothetical protein n=1 Tax=Micromonospora coerulea TaxID=47856 RepID=UPI0019032A15|nr:hypothetical protein [Micromonospora veneta]